MIARAVAGCVAVAALVATFAALMTRERAERPDVDSAPAGVVSTSPIAVGSSAVPGTVPGDDDLIKRARNAFQSELLAMPEAALQSVMRLAIQDNALDCSDVTGTQVLAPGVPAWRVSCAGPRAYIVEVDGLGRFVIEPQIYHEGPVMPRVPAETFPNTPRERWPERFQPLR